MARKRRTSRADEGALLDPGELDVTGVEQMRDEVGLFTSDYGRWQRSRSEIPPPQISALEPVREGPRRR